MTAKLDFPGKSGITIMYVACMSRALVQAPMLLETKSLMPNAEHAEHITENKAYNIKYLLTMDYGPIISRNGAMESSKSMCRTGFSGSQGRGLPLFFFPFLPYSTQITNICRIKIPILRFLWYNINKQIDYRESR